MVSSKLLSVIAALAALSAAEPAIIDAAALQASIRSQVSAQLAASLANAVPVIVSQSAANVINSQLAQFPTTPVAAAPAPAPPAATQAAAAPAAAAATPQVVQAAQPAATPPAAAAAAAAPAVAPTQVAQAAQPAATQQAAAPQANNAGNAATAPVAGSGGSTLVSVSANAGAGVTTAKAGSGATTLSADDLTVSSLPGGGFVTLDSAGSTITSSIATTGSGAPRVKTLGVGDSDLSGNTTIHTTSSLSKAASIGLGVGLGALALFLVAGFLLFRWRKKRSGPHPRRTPSMIISAPMHARHEGGLSFPIEMREGGASYPVNMREVDGASSPKAASELEHSLSVSSNSASYGSPISSGSYTLGYIPNSGRFYSQPGIVELMGSGPSEMQADVAGSEVQGSPVERKSGETDALPASDVARSDSILKTPLNAYVPPGGGMQRAERTESRR